MVVIHPKLGICWSYVVISIYMTNISTVVMMANNGQQRWIMVKSRSKLLIVQIVVDSDR